MGNSPSRRNRRLEKAIQARKPKRVKRCLQRGGNPNAYSKKSNYSFLSMAITLREEKIVHLLLAEGADPNQKSWLATSKGSLQRKQNNDNEYPIHIGAAHGGTNIMKALLNAGANIDMGQDHKLGTALHQAARFGHAKLAEQLLTMGCDIIAIDSRLNIPLHIAATYGQIKVAEVLLEHGSPVNTVNMKNWTPLHCAASEGALTMVKLLLSHGGNPQARDGTEKTPIDVAKSDDILRVFIEYTIENPNNTTNREVFVKDRAKKGVSDAEHKNKSTSTQTDSEMTHRVSTKTTASQVTPDVPPKPARTFTVSTSTLERIVAEQLQESRPRSKSHGVINLSFHEYDLERSKSRSSKKKARKAEQTGGNLSLNHRDELTKPTNQAKSAAAKPKRAKSAPFPKPRRSTKSRDKHPSSSPNTAVSRSKTTKAAPQKTQKAVRNLTVTYKRHEYRVQDNTEPKSTKDEQRSKTKEQKRANSMAVASQHRNGSINTRRPISPKEVNAEVLRNKNIGIEEQETPKTVAQNNRLRASLSQSLTNLTCIAEEGPRDANFNLHTKKTVNRTRSDKSSNRMKTVNEKLFLEKTQSECYG